MEAIYECIACSRPVDAAYRLKPWGHYCPLRYITGCDGHVVERPVGPAVDDEQAAKAQEQWESNHE